MPPSASDARFRDDLIAALGRVPAGSIGLAVSGGPDSMALLVLAQGGFPGAIAVATVDHGLRAESASEAAMVAAQCETLGVPHATLHPAADITGASVQAGARVARYDALAAWSRANALDCIATAHHADDQAETFLMRAARGSGLNGLAGVRRSVELAGVRVVRPLLDWRRAELRAIVRRAEIPFVDDPANRDARHDRTRFRGLLEANEWLDPPALARATAHLGEAERDLAAMTEILCRDRVALRDGVVIARLADLPRTMRRSLLREAIIYAREHFAITTPDFDHATNIEPLLDALAAGRTATQGGLRIAAAGAEWRLQPAPPRRSH